MAVIDVAGLLQPVSPEEPSGPDLQYDPVFAELETLSRGKPEQQFGKTVIPGEEPDWRALEKGAMGLLGRSRDLRAAVHLTKALIRTSGWVGLADGLALIRGLVEQRWDSFYPQLDPEDNDPTERVNILSPLNDYDTVIGAVRKMPLARSRNVGQFALRDIAMAKGEEPVPAGATAPKQQDIDAAFTDMPLEELQETGAAVHAAREHAAAIEAGVAAQVGIVNGVSLDRLVKTLVDCERALAEPLARRGVVMNGAAAAVPADGEAAPAAGGNGAAAPAAVAAVAGQIRSREDVIRTLDKICEYYATNEPSSPVPLVLQRAKALVSKDFLSLLRDLAPAGVNELGNVVGKSVIEGK
jgi:type VI secretion system protein ImpA